jgi:hypothetical protein
MFNLEMVLLLITGVFFSYIIYLQIKINNKNKKIKELLSLNDRHKNVDFKYVEDAMKFLDKIIQEKYKYHLYATLLPVYLDKQIPEKKMISEIKEKIYVSVVGSLTSETKKSILNFFTEKGIEIYIHEKIMVHMNETDFRSTEKFTEAFRDIKSKNVDQLIP